MKFILGKKLGMTQIFDEKGNMIPVSLIQAGPCSVSDVKTKERDGYQAVQIGFEKKDDKKAKKSQKGKNFRYLKEFRSETDAYKVGQEIDVSAFKEGEKVLVSGISKGKGFAGVVKRWGFAGRPSSHGTKHEVRGQGSIGASTPSRVVKGIRMAGRMGSDRNTVKNLKIVKVEPKDNLLMVKGAVPGKRGALLEIYSKD